jgi:hypothetical protein
VHSSSRSWQTSTTRREPYASQKRKIAEVVFELPDDDDDDSDDDGDHDDDDKRGKGKGKKQD